MTVEKTFRINISPGCLTNSRITFYREGDQVPNRIPANIVFIIRDIPHPEYAREGQNLIYTAVINLRQMLCCAHIPVPMLQAGTEHFCAYKLMLNPGSSGSGASYKAKDCPVLV